MTSFSPIQTLLAPGLLVLFLSVRLDAATEETIYAKIGDKVTLEPKASTVTAEIQTITWKVGQDLAAELENGQLEFYREFKGRSDLNNQTGDFTITNLQYGDGNVYRVEINGNPGDHSIRLQVLSPVPVPTIHSTCHQDSNSCTLTCEGNTTRAEPVNYVWMKKDGSEVNTGREYMITEKDLGVKEYFCKMKNEVSQESSQPFLNPLTPPPKSQESGPRISAGLTVFVILLALVLLLGILHRVKTGECFYNKSSYPWEADFWRNTKGQQPQAAAEEANGATHHPLKENTDETSFGNE
ncbi:uncharacterized protein LOC119792308 [Cyprinodon tularosa]|uniref:uncharacterized protein LOC119792308 n=1 Tax=Cyprinodon tularosa TaxID=77115 RepID=UPI0018E1F3D0|nr:uncharacterized protein LOC119792308 [Cyprinodon tularosa]